MKHGGRKKWTMNRPRRLLGRKLRNVSKYLLSKQPLYGTSSRASKIAKTANPKRNKTNS
jgi:hypothetical protein